MVVRRVFEEEMRKMIAIGGESIVVETVSSAKSKIPGTIPPQGPIVHQLHQTTLMDAVGRSFDTFATPARHELECVYTP